METIYISREQLKSMLNIASLFYKEKMEELREDTENPNRQSGLMGTFHRKAHIDYYIKQIEKGNPIEIVTYEELQKIKKDKDK